MNKRKKQNQIRQETRPYCVYCQKEIGITDDEVIAKGLYRGNPPAKEGYIVVPACKNCNNNLKSKDDESLRELTTFDNDARNNAAAQSIFNNNILPKVRANPTKLTPIQFAAAFKSRSVAGFTKSGIYLGEYHEIKLEYWRVERIFRWIQQGLHYRFTGKYLSPHIDLKVAKLNYEEGELVLATFKEYGYSGSYITESNVFNCIFSHNDSISGVSYSLLQFYGGVIYLVITTPPNFLEIRESILNTPDKEE